MNFLGADVSALSTLLDQSREAEEELEVGRQCQQPPMAVGQTKVVVGSQQIAAEKTLKAEQAAASKNDIWQADEIPTEDAILSLTDDRPCPRYEFSYKQLIGTQDSFLGLNGKTPGSMDCSHLVVKVHFPGCTMRDLDLDVTRDRIKAASPGACPPQYITPACSLSDLIAHFFFLHCSLCIAGLKLFTYLPQAVRHDEGKAAFDKKTEVLTVTLPIINELFE
jgi:hypothetical protein